MNTENQKILITGASGFVGRALCRALVGKELDVQMLLRDPRRFKQIAIGLNANMILGSLDNKASLALACAGVDQIIHLAGIAHVANRREDELVTVNVSGTQSLVDEAIKAGVNRLIFVSSTLASAAESETGDLTLYGKSKLAAERLLQKAAGDKLIEAIILRPVNVYGPGMKGNIARMIELLDSGRLPPLPFIENRLSLISADDLAQTIVAALDSESLPTIPMTVTDGHEYSIEGIERAIYENLGKAQPSWRTPAVLLYCASAIAGLVSATTGKGSISTRTYRNLTRDNAFSNDLAIENLGFVPQKTFYESLPQIIENMRKSDK